MRFSAGVAVSGLSSSGCSRRGLRLGAAAAAAHRLSRPRRPRISGESSHDLAKRLLGERELLLAQMGEAQRVQHLQIVRHALGGAGQQHLRAHALASTQRDHAFESLDQG